MHKLRQPSQCIPRIRWPNLLQFVPASHAGLYCCSVTAKQLGMRSRLAFWEGLCTC